MYLSILYYCIYVGRSVVGMDKDEESCVKCSISETDLIQLHERSVEDHLCKYG